jgi:hypothetical protein
MHDSTEFRTEFRTDSGQPVSLPQALQALPLLTPARSAWPALQAELARRQKPSRARWPFVFAAAAVLALAAVLPRWMAEPVDTIVVPVADVPPTPAPSEQDRLRALMDESAQLEALIEWSRTERVESASMESLAAGVQSRVSQIDALLARTDADPQATLPLWQERVLRLRQLVDLENTQQLLAANGDVDPGVPMLAF